MPIYEYKCQDCEERTEAIQRLADPPLAICPHCGGTLEKLMSAPAFQFKGSGWYVTDYADKGKKEAAASESGSSGESKSSSKTDKAENGKAGGAKDATASSE